MNIAAREFRKYNVEMCEFRRHFSFCIVSDYVRYTWAAVWDIITAGLCENFPICFCANSMITLETNGGSDPSKPSLPGPGKSQLVGM